MINHGKIKKHKTYEEGIKKGFGMGYTKGKKDTTRYYKRKYHMIDIDEMTSGIAKEYGQE